MDGAIGLRNTLVLVSEAELGQGTASDKETSGVSYGGMNIAQSEIEQVTHQLSSWSDRG